MTCATRLRTSTATISALSIETKVVSRVCRLRSRSAIARSKASPTSFDRSAAQGLPVALGEGDHDRLVGALRALHEGARIEARLGLDTGLEAAGDLGAGLGDAAPVARGRGRGDGAACTRSAPGRRTTLSPSGPRLRLGAAAVHRLERRALRTGLLAEHRAQTPDHEDGERQEDDRRNVETVLHHRSDGGRGATLGPLLRSRAVRRRQSAPGSWRLISDQRARSEPVVPAAANRSRDPDLDMGQVRRSCQRAASVAHGSLVQGPAARGSGPAVWASSAV